VLELFPTNQAAVLVRLEITEAYDNGAWIKCSGNAANTFGELADKEVSGRWVIGSQLSDLGFATFADTLRE